MSTDPYGSLGVEYATRRRTDPRLQAHIERALVGARTVVNIGAGAGSYETPGTVLAVEPSRTMIAQRPEGCAPAVRARAEALPLPEGSVDAALAVLTLHHWTDPAAGIAEMVRVAARQVVLTWEPTHLARTFWLITDYLPEIAEHEAALACLDSTVALLREHGRAIRVHSVPLPADCQDGVLAAHWARPRAYLDPAVRAAASGLALLPDTIVARALDRLGADLDSGRWHQRHQTLLGHDELDLGYRIVVADHLSERRRP